MKAKLIKNKILIVIVFAMTCVFLLANRSHIQHEQSFSLAQELPDGWKSLFNGETLDGWEKVPYWGGGTPYVENAKLILPMATIGLMTGIRWVGDSLPTINYVIQYEARRVQGDDIFAALTFPYDDTFASIIFGGWGGIINGLSSVDGYDASENETTQLYSLLNNDWHQVQLRVTTDSIKAFVGYETIVDIATAGKHIHLRDETLDTGLTFWSYSSTGEIRNIRIKEIL